jgi:DNA-binding NtrC family response regulator
MPAPQPAAFAAPVAQQTVFPPLPADAVDKTLPGITLEEMERRLILQTLEQVNGNRTRAADMLGVSVRTIRNKLSQYGIASQIPEPQGVGV